MKPVRFQDFVDAVKTIGRFWGVLNVLRPGGIDTVTGVTPPKADDMKILHLEDSDNDAELIHEALRYEFIECSDDTRRNSRGIPRSAWITAIGTSFWPTTRCLPLTASRP